jgi:hypothetical protein
MITRLAALPILLLAATLTTAAEAPILGPLTPDPHTTPLAPRDDKERDARDQTTLLVEERLGQLREKIEAITRRYGDNLPAIDLRYRIELEEERSKRDRSWQHLLEILDAEQEAIVRREADVLDTPSADLEQIEVGNELMAANHLRVVECYQQLLEQALTPENSQRYLTEARRTLSRIDAEQLADPLRPRYRYQQVWFAVAKAQRSEGDERLQALGQARRHLQVLTTDHPDSVLVDAARERLATLTLERPDKDQP